MKSRKHFEDFYNDPDPWNEHASINRLFKKNPFVLYFTNKTTTHDRNWLRRRSALFLNFKKCHFK